MAHIRLSIRVLKRANGTSSFPLLITTRLGLRASVRRADLYHINIRFYPSILPHGLLVYRFAQCYRFFTGPPGVHLRHTSSSQPPMRLSSQSRTPKVPSSAGLAVPDFLVDESEDGWIRRIQSTLVSVINIEP